MFLEYNLADKVDGFHGFGNFLQPESAAALLALPLLSERITNELENLLLSSFKFATVFENHPKVSALRVNVRIRHFG